MLLILWIAALNGIQKNLQVKIHQQADGLCRNKTLSGKTKRHELRSNFESRHYESRFKNLEEYQYPIGLSLVSVK